MSTASFRVYAPLNSDIAYSGTEHYLIGLRSPSIVYSMREDFVLIELYCSNIPLQPAVYVPLGQDPYTYLQTIYPEFFI